jgi:hypothetical protein
VYHQKQPPLHSGRLLFSRNFTTSELSLGSLGLSGETLDLAAGVGRLQRKSCVMGFTQVCGADRIAVGGVQKFLVEGWRAGAVRAVRSVVAAQDSWAAMMARRWFSAWDGTTKTP